MIKPICIVLMVFLIVSNAFAGTAWEEYLSHPNPDNAAKVNKIEYTPGAIPKDYGYWAPDLNILLNQVMGGDEEAFKLTYRLILVSEGGLAEDLTVIISHTIRSHPEFFLKEMVGLRPQNAILKAILLMPGAEYVDRSEAQRYEIEMRKKALISVSNKSYIDFKDRCLKTLNGK
jgi:hypothetical protein